MQILNITTAAPRQWLDITEHVAQALRATPIQEGACLVFSPHTTASVVLGEHWDPDVVSDLLAFLADRVPNTWPAWRHQEGNSAAHLLQALFGSSATVPVHQGALALGRWQGIFLAEWDGPRTRQVYVQCLPA